MEAAWRRVRAAAMAAAAEQLAQRESDLAQRERAVEDCTTCALCMDAPRALAFNCGHQVPFIGCRYRVGCCGSGQHHLHAVHGRAARARLQLQPPRARL